MKFCKDCKHYSPKSGTCESPRAENERNRVSGEWPEAQEMRSYGTIGCTKDALWFEPTYPNKDSHD